MISKKSEAELLFGVPARNDNGVRSSAKTTPDQNELLRRYIRLREDELEELRRELRAAEGMAAAGRC